MAHYLFSLWPFRTHLQPNIAVGRAVLRRGDRVSFYTHESFRRELEREGFGFHPFRRVSWDRTRETVDALIEGRMSPREMRRHWREFLVDQVPEQVADLDEILGEGHHDAIVCDLSFWAPLLLRERFPVPVAALSHVTNCLLPGRQNPVPGVALPRVKNWWIHLAGKLAGAAASLVTGDTRNAAEGLRKRFGLPPIGCSVTEFAGTAPVYLIPGCPEFDYDRSDLAPNVRYVGTLSADFPALSTPPSWISAASANGPFVLVEEGALYTQKPLLIEAALAGLKDLGRTVVVMRGELRGPEFLPARGRSGNLWVVDYVPIAQLLPFTSLLVTNGNSDCVTAALSAGIPLVVSPSLWDQKAVGWRVADTGCGIRLPESQCTPRRLEAAVRCVLENPAYREAAAALGAALQRRGGADSAAAHLAALAPATAASRAATMKIR